MIRGSVNQRCAIEIVLGFADANNETTDVAVMVDTGYEGNLALPLSLVERLARVPLGTTQLRMVDGTVVSVDQYVVGVEWFGHRRMIAVEAIGDQPLLGMSLLRGHRLTIDVTPAGPVTVAPL